MKPLTSLSHPGTELSYNAGDLTTEEGLDGGVGVIAFASVSGKDILSSLHTVAVTSMAVLSPGMFTERVNINKKNVSQITPRSPWHSA